MKVGRLTSRPWALAARRWRKRRSTSCSLIPARCTGDAGPSVGWNSKKLALEEGFRLGEELALALALCREPVDLVPQQLCLLERLERCDEPLLLGAEHLD